MNQLLNRPLEEPFLTEEIGLEDPSLDYIETEIKLYLSNMWYFDIFRDFMSQLSSLLAPELRAFDAAISAQQRSLTASGRAFFVPEILFQGELARTFLGGTGSSGLGILEGLIPPDADISGPDQTNWSLALDISLPLFTSGRRLAVKSQDFELLSELKLDRELTSQRIRAARSFGASHRRCLLRRYRSGPGCCYGGGAKPGTRYRLLLPRCRLYPGFVGCPERLLVG